MDDRIQGDKQVWKFWLRLGLILLMALAALLASVAFGEPPEPNSTTPEGARSPGRVSRSAPTNRELKSDRPSSATGLTLRVYNYAQTDPILLAQSEKVATAIFADLGVELVWLDCPLSQAQFHRYPACESDLGQADLVVRILPHRMAVKLVMADEPLGFAQLCPEREPACELSVFYDQVDELAARGYRADRILGFVIAHEITHVLIGPGHSSEGIMRGVWSDYDLQRISWGVRLDFTSDQAKRLRSALLRRTNFH